MVIPEERSACTISLFCRMGVRLGEYNIMTEPDCDPSGQICEPPVQDMLINKTIIHPFYDPSTFINDIALIKLATPANFSYGNLVNRGT